MQLSEYQARALETALPTALTPDYLVPGLVAEVGELFGHRAKAVRDGWSPARLREETISEYGDIAWMAAVLLHTQGISEDYANRIPDLRRDANSGLIYAAATLYESEAYPPGNMRLDQAALVMWRVLESSSRAVTGWSFDAVLRVNLDKLAGRAQRGTLAGSGDHR